MNKDLKKKCKGDISAEIGQRVRRFREKRGLSQIDLAVLSGLHRTYINSLENGHRNITIKNLARIARVLDVRMTDLTNIDESDNEENIISNHQENNLFSAGG